jgi:hypothetical protein
MSADSLAEARLRVIENVSAEPSDNDDVAALADVG